MEGTAEPLEAVLEGSAELLTVSELFAGSDGTRASADAGYDLPEIERDRDTKRRRDTETEGAREQTRMNNNNETNTLTPLWPCLWTDSCYENVPQSNIILTNVRSLAQYGLTDAYLNNSNV